MDKETIKLFMRWLEDANAQELDAKRQEIQSTYKRVSSREGRSSLNLALRLLDEEILSRLALKKLG